MFSILILLGAIPSVWAAGLFPRSVQTEVTCSNDFQWADNQVNMNPCLVAAYAEGACYAGCKPYQSFLKNGGTNCLKHGPSLSCSQAIIMIFILTPAHGRLLSCGFRTF